MRVTATSLHGDYRVLVLAPFGKDAVLVREVLERSGIPVGVVGDVAAIARCVGGGAGAAIVAEESLDEEGIELLGRSVSRSAHLVRLSHHRSHRRRRDHSLHRDDGSLAHSHGQSQSD